MFTHRPSKMLGRPAQLAFEGIDFEPRPHIEKAPVTPRIDPVFLAFRPDAEAGTRIEQLTQGLRRRHLFRRQSLGITLFHVSMQLLGEGGQSIPAIVDMAEAIASSVAIAPFPISFNRVLSFRSKSKRRPLALCGAVDASLSAFRAALGAAVARVGLGGLVTARFNPHVTLLYDETIVVEEAIEPVGWTVGELLLLQTLMGQRRQVELGRWQLRD